MGNNRSSQLSSVIKKGDIVLLKDKHTIRGWWKLARVVELLVGRGNQVHAAKIWVMITSSQKKP